MTNLRDLLNAARRERSTVHQMHLQDGSRVTTTHSTGPATHELIALAPQLAAALIKAEGALNEIRHRCGRSLYDGGLTDYEKIADAALAEIRALTGGNDD